MANISERRSQHLLPEEFIEFHALDKAANRAVESDREAECVVSFFFPDGGELVGITSLNLTADDKDHRGVVPNCADLDGLSR
ncbi:hypothetical protein HED50_22595 [Ochrobactrum oryzae]|nr:hypothetical protein [Brucella oryzae]